MDIEDETEDRLNREEGGSRNAVYHPGRDADLRALESLQDPDFVPLAFQPGADVSRNPMEFREDEYPTFDHELEEVLVETGVKHNGSKGPSPGYAERHRAIARYNAMGLSNNQIAKKLGYSPTAISLALKKPHVQAEVERFRTQFFDEDIARAMKSMGTDAVKLIHGTILDESEKSELRSTNARWAVEKLTGKASQQVNVESNTLGAFMDLLREAQATGQTLEPAILDVTPTDLVPNPEGVRDQDKGPDFDAWLDLNLKKP